MRLGSFVCRSLLLLPIAVSEIEQSTFVPELVS